MKYVFIIVCLLCANTSFADTNCPEHSLKTIINSRIFDPYLARKTIKNYLLYNLKYFPIVFMPVYPYFILQSTKPNSFTTSVDKENNLLNTIVDSIKVYTDLDISNFSFTKLVCTIFSNNNSSYTDYEEETTTNTDWFSMAYSDKTQLIRAVTTCNNKITQEKASNYMDSEDPFLYREYTDESALLRYVMRATYADCYAYLLWREYNKDNTFRKEDYKKTKKIFTSNSDTSRIIIERVLIAAAVTELLSNDSDGINLPGIKKEYNSQAEEIWDIFSNINYIPVSAMNSLLE